jgi:hypothetical protein
LVIAVGATLAAVNAYLISQGIGRPLAERIIRSEMGEGTSGSPVARQLAAVQDVIKVGFFWGRAGAALTCCAAGCRAGWGS